MDSMIGQLYESCIVPVMSMPNTVCMMRI